VPEIVRSNLVHKNVHAPYNLLERASDVLGGLLTKGDVSLSAIDAVIFLSVMLEGYIPPNFRKIVTGSVLHDLVDQQYQLGMKFDEGWRRNFELAAKPAELVDLVVTSEDACEAILFNGADSLVRMGSDPAPLVEKMQSRGFGSAEYVLGSYFYHQKRDSEQAKIHFRRAQRARAFTKRTARALAKIYLQEGNARAALDTLDALGKGRVNRDSGLLAQKIRCLNATGNRAEAQNLMGILRTLEDDYGDYDSLRAAECLRTGNYAEALLAIERAKARPKANRINLILECAPGAGQDQAAGLTVCRAWWSSNWAGLR
jgi:tetratricopeptide (TPR) repeat protein